MTVAAKPSTASYIEDGVTVSFAAPFRFKAATDLIVERIAAGVVQALVLGIDYTVTGGATDAGGTVTRTAASIGALLRIRRSTTRAQPMVYATGDRFPAASHEGALDTAMLIDQEQDAVVGDLSSRALQLPPGETAAPLAPQASRIGGAKKILGIDQGTGAVIVEPIDDAYVGPTGPANSTYSTLSLLQAADVTNGSAILTASGLQGTFTWTSGNFTGAADNFNIVASNNASLSAGAWVRQNATGKVNVRNHGAIGNGIIDDTAALLAAATAANALGLPLYLPSGSYILNASINPQYGIVGEGSAVTKLMATSASAFVAGVPMVHLGWTKASNSALCFGIPAHGFSIIGSGIRTANRSTDQSTMLFNGDGVLFDEQCHSIRVRDVQVSFCRRGFDFGGVYGHLSIVDCVSSNCWYNTYFSRNGYDYSFVNCILTGALFASIGASGTLDNSKNQAKGGLAGLTVTCTHTGFGPFGYYQEPGNGTIGIIAWLADLRFEYIGNRAISLPAGTNSGVLTLKNEGHSFVPSGAPDYASYTITSDPTNYPVQDYAMVLGSVMGSAAPSYRQGTQWQLGSTGKHTLIAGGLFDFWEDDKGIGGYAVTGQGQERLVFSAQQNWRDVAGVASQAINAAGGSRTTLATFNVPEAYDGTLFGEIDLSGNVYTSNALVDASVRVTAGGLSEAVVGVIRFLNGPGNTAGRYRFPLGRRAAGVHTVQVVLQFTATANIALNDSSGLNGSIGFVAGQNTGIA